MPASLDKMHFHIAVEGAAASRSAQSRQPSVPAGLEDAAPPMTFSSDEAAARFYLDQLLQEDDRPTMRSITEPDRPERVPGLVLDNERDLPLLGTHQVRFTQAHDGIPIFGSRAVVELTGERSLVSIDADLGAVTGVSPVESLSRADALQRVADYTGTPLSAQAALGGHLAFYRDEESGTWHLAWHLTDVPAEPPVTEQEPVPDDAMVGHGLGPRPVPVRYDYLVDAHSGDILFQFSTVPTALPTPARCKGIDENEATQRFLGTLVPGGTTCRLSDPLRNVRTYDLEFADIDDDPPVPAQPVQAATSDFAITNRAAISAHVNASRVQDFYKTVLQREGIDDQGMDLISLVNVTAASMQPPPTLLNAFWFNGRMWYGQIKRDGRMVSLSRYLDVIGHELTHGVVESTSKLVYATQSGALNESFADTFGVIINNWYTAADRNDITTWTWGIGAGLRSDGKPLRDFADPTRLGHPAHMNDFRALKPGELPNGSNDQGWVHTNSNIHNKAMHNLLSLTDPANPTFSVEDVAVLAYLGMARLAPLATFADAKQAVLDVAETYFGGDADKIDKIQTIRQAYAKVGIS